MASFRDHLPLAIITIVLCVALFILFKEVKLAKDQAAIGARLAATLQEQQQQHMLQYQQLPQQFVVEAPPQDVVPHAPEPVDEDEVDAPQQVQEPPQDQRPVTAKVQKRR